MSVRIDLDPIPTFPAIAGAHELAWSYILDAIFADAFAAGLGALHLILPSAALHLEVEMRADLMVAPSGTVREGVAYLSGRVEQQPTRADRIYTLEFSLAAPRRVRSHALPLAPAGLHCERRLSVYTWKAFVWGIPIQLAHRARRPDLADRSHYAMRRDFTRAQSVPAYYHLEIWSRK